MAIRNSLKVHYAALLLVGVLLSACGTGSIMGEPGDGSSGGGGYVIPGGEISGDWDIQVVDDNGNVRHCELLPPIGNLRDQSFDEIWNSPEAKAARQRIIARQCRCTHECNAFESLMANPLHGLNLLRSIHKQWRSPGS